MEGEAGGQLGGMECSSEVRAKMAGESPAWRCEGCGMRNEEILEESAEKAKELGARRVEVVPEGLKLGYKDEAGESSSGGGGGLDTPGTPQSQSSTPVELPPTTPQLPVAQVNLPPPLPPHLQGQLPAYLHPMYAPQPPPAPVRVETPWLDKFIWALVVALAALVVRRYWGLELIV